MGERLSRVAHMELRREDRDKAEIYVLPEVDIILHQHRALKRSVRRELYFTRLAILVLLLVFTGFFLYFYSHSSACECKGHESKANAEQPKGFAAHVGARDPDLEKTNPAALITELPNAIGEQADAQDPDLEKTNPCALIAELPNAITEQVDAPEPDPVKTHSATLILGQPQEDVLEGNIKWMKRNDLVGFTLEQDGESLVVPEDGIYRITLQVTYSNYCESDEPKQIQLSHHIDDYTGSYSEPRVLLYSYDTVYCDNELWKKSMYSGKDFLLQAGDKLVVKTDNLDLLMKGDKIDTKTFFTARYVSKL